MNINNLIDDDLKFIWHPCTQMKDMLDFPLLPIKNGKGVYLYDFNDNRYIDCISSWWVNLFGHSNDYINSKIKEQLEILEHIIFAGYTHEGIIKYSKRLISKLPNGLDKCFYADNGSSAIEIALKMSYHYYLLQDEKRNMFLSLENSYHGETIGALSLGDVSLYKNTYNDLLISNIITKIPNDSSSIEIETAIHYLDKLLHRYGNKICAFILEPLIQCAGGMRIYSSDFIYKATQLCRSYGICIIFDEIAVGFGRSGEMFALEECNVVPDFLCLSKGITGGYLPLSVVITSNEIYNTFYGDYNKAFLHSHSYTGNPLSIACANATLDIFETNNTIVNNKILSEHIFLKFQEFRNFDIVTNIRYKGMVFAFDLNINCDRTISLEFSQLALKEGLIIRPLGNVVYFMPPYIITNEEVDFVINALTRLLYKLNMKF